MQKVSKAIFPQALVDKICILVLWQRLAVTIIYWATNTKHLLAQLCKSTIISSLYLL